MDYLLGVTPLPLGLTPLSEAEFTVARETAEQFKSPAVRRQLSGMLLLARGAGASVSDLRYVCGSDVSTVPGSGTWVEFGRPGHERRVPVLVRFADDLGQVARQARGGPLLGSRDQSLPLPAAAPEVLLEELLARLRPDRPEPLITVERLRRAWLVEHLCGPLPVREFFQLTGESSRQSVRELADFCSPPAMDDARISRLMGAVNDDEAFDLSAWSLD